MLAVQTCEGQDWTICQRRLPGMIYVEEEGSHSLRNLFAKESYRATCVHRDVVALLN
jgi:hypothetical protein